MIEASFLRLLEQTRAVWNAGGWAMAPLAANGMVIFGMGVFVLLRLASKGLFASPERAWRRWQKRTGHRRGTFDVMIATAMASRSLEELEHYLDAVRSDEILPFERDLRVMKIGITTAPLLGLLGTVTGMLSTFNALATGGGGEQTMSMIAGGISEALITTETGLVLALSGMMFQYVLTRQHERFQTRIEHVATLCMQAWRKGDHHRRAA